MRIVLSVLLLGHGVAHLPGFLVDLRLRSSRELPFRTTVLSGAVDIGEAGIKVVGLAWLTVTITFGVLAIAAFVRVPWWPPFAYLAVGLSIPLCLLGWPEARLGILANLVILMLLVFGHRVDWL